LEKLKLDKKHFFILTSFFAFIFCIHLYLYYEDYKQIKISNYYQTSLLVIDQYHKKTKRGKVYELLKVRLKNGIKFFAITWQKGLPNLKNSIIKCKIPTKKITFFKYLKGSFLPIYDIKIVKYTKRNIYKKIDDFIVSQHKSKITKELFEALFIGKKIDKNIRKDVSLLGISHLVAISGFHLGVLSFLIIFILTPLYKIFQDKFFPYRNRMLDLMIVSVVLLFLYLYLVGFIPSLLRAYVMMVIGYIFYIRYIDIFSYETLFLTVVALLAFFPELTFSVAFWFSVCGVFYIFLFLYYFSKLKPWQIFVALNFWVYFLIQPIIHYIFPTFALSQLLSPILSMFFVLFYPMELFLHLIREGGLFDKVVLNLFNFSTQAISFKTPIWFLCLYVATTLSAIYKKIFLYLLVFEGVLFFSYLFYRYTFG